MRNFIAVSAIFAALIGCQTASKDVMKEPDRSGFYYACMSGSFHVTTCGCVEGKLVEAGIRTDADASDPEKDANKVILAAIPECVAETEKLLEAAE